MALQIPISYLKDRDDQALWPLYIISAPERVPELQGYVMKIMQDYTRLSDDTINILYGNDWKKKQQKMYFMFEREVKVPGHPSKRYQYTEEEIKKLYENALHI